ncbi:Peptidyl-prolyl cis-trans isomerase CYP65 [Camellia lanceoleosa]|uniref:Peptidyl-prolyl cis-trans isomerase CYP65 n=1 Tax=Camellia lanceoleosa TaxID=1840588 RepID=A0ACC0HI52_9ERIC|nr:Peptidyl-prolyl cis-trans isomerase CYP65 [Camellia lanceoleosa]
MGFWRGLVVVEGWRRRRVRSEEVVDLVLDEIELGNEILKVTRFAFIFRFWFSSLSILSRSIGRFFLLQNSDLIVDAAYASVHGRSAAAAKATSSEKTAVRIAMHIAAKSGGGEDLNGDMAEFGILQIQRSNVPVFPFPFSSSQSE